MSGARRTLLTSSSSSAAVVTCRQHRRNRSGPLVLVDQQRQLHQLLRMGAAGAGRHYPYHQQTAGYSSARTNTLINFVPQQEAWVIERMGKFFKVLNPGVNVLIPIIDSVKYVQSLKEIAIEIPQQAAITVDNVALTIDGVLYLKVVDPYKASYGVEDPEFAISQLAQTTMRSEVGKIDLDTVFRERETLNEKIVFAINKASEPWGIVCLRYEIRDMKMPPKIQEAMQMQVEAERRKRATILESEGVREADINRAEGRKRSTVLASEANMMEQINRAEGEAKAILAKARARAEGIKNVAVALSDKCGPDAASLAVAEQYVKAFSNLAKDTNTVIVPANAADASSMVAQAMTLYKRLGVEQVRSNIASVNNSPGKQLGGGSSGKNI